MLDGIVARRSELLHDDIPVVLFYHSLDTRRSEEHTSELQSPS